ncbi:MAG: DoxX family protein [Tannerella sp.]|jgi:uncharacterized membrane protein YphA (DoxX/SURF4 family)|nr:DoxX family protein [Tannerella sp.]
MKLKKKTVLIEICRFLLGTALVLSGFFKAIDPWGSAYKIDEYLGAFGLRYLTAFDLSLSFIQIALEFTVGACLLLGIYRKRTTLLALVIMLFMTPLTLYLAFKNPISDCGCFGDALIISNWQTFFKNVVLLAAAVYLFQHKKSLVKLFSRKKYFITFLWILFFIVGFSTYSYMNLPVIDFRPYKIGTNIKEKMEIPDGAEQSKYETTLIYSKNGVSKEFNINNYPKDDSTWTFVDSRNRLIKKGYVPPIHDFTITNSHGEDITDAILDNPSYTFLLISSKIENAKDYNILLINDIYDYARLNGYGFYALTASLNDDIKKWKESTAAEYPFCTTDETALKTIVRSNPGLLLIKDGIILNKWSNNKLPSKLDKPLEESRLGQQGSNQSLQKIIITLLVLLIPLAVLYLLDKYYNREKKHGKRHGKKSNHYLDDIKKKQAKEQYKHINQK